MKLAILGGGAWGTALAIAFARHHTVTVWVRDAEHAADMAATRINARYLPEQPLPEDVTVTAKLPHAIDGAELIIIGTPVAGLRPVLRALTAIMTSMPPLLWVCKGLEMGSSLLPHQVVGEELPASVECGVISGPSFAQEVAHGLPTAVVVAANETPFAQAIAQELHSPLLRLYANDDLVGVEIGGAVKNVLAIATGVADGLVFGLNARAALITRGLAEITRLAVALGAKQQTMMGLAGTGDLILTCTSELSRNRQVGLQLAQRKPLGQILTGLGHVAEGVTTAREVLKMAERLAVDMPITAAVCEILYEGAEPERVVEELLNRAPKSEWGGSLAGIY